MSVLASTVIALLTMLLTTLCVSWLLTVADGFSLSAFPGTQRRSVSSLASVSDRREWIEQTIKGIGFASVAPILSVAVAGELSVPSPASATPQEFQNLGTQAPLPVGETNEFITLDNGVKYKTFREGAGSEAVQPGNKVMNSFVSPTGR